MKITLEDVAMLVECPVCGACDIGGDSVEACWDAEGREHVPVHESRLADAKEHLIRARAASALSAESPHRNRAATMKAKLLRAHGVFLRLVFLAEGPLWTVAAVGVALGWAHFPHGFWAGVSAVVLVLFVPIAWVMTYLAITEDWEIDASAESSYGTGRP